MNLDDFDYNLPKALIAQKPLPVRTDSRLLTDIDNQIKHSTMNDFPEMIKEGDLIVTVSYTHLTLPTIYSV